jgi:Glycosyltransferase family 87
VSSQASSINANRGIALASRRSGAVFLFGLLPAVTLIVIVARLFGTNLGHPPMFDYHGDLWAAGRSILDGESPYHTAGLAHRLAAINQGHDVDPAFALPVYPATALVIFTPLSLLPYTAAAAVFLAILVAAILGSLWVLGVRDWRCYGAMFLSYPVLYGLILGNVTPLLMLAAALAWRHRDRTRVAGSAVGVAVAFKLFLWPLVLWLLIAGRRRAAGVAVAVAGVLTIACWAAIGFAGLRGYPHLLSLLSSVESHAAYSPYALASSLGAGRLLAATVAAAIGLGLVAAAFAKRDQERIAFGLCLLAALALSPVVWSHYYAVLYLPIALRSPRFSVVWLAPALLWPIADPATTTLQIAVFMGLVSVVCALVMVERPLPWMRRAALPR